MEILLDRRNLGNNVYPIDPPIFFPSCVQPDWREDPVSVAAVTFWDADPAKDEAKIVSFWSFHHDYVLEPTEMVPFSPATHVSVVVIKNRRPNKPNTTAKLIIQHADVFAEAMKGIDQ